MKSGVLPATILALMAPLLFDLSGCTLRRMTLVPPEVENAPVPADKYTGVHAVCLYDAGWVHYHPKGLVEGPSLVFTRQVKIKLLTRAATEADRFGNIAILHVGPLIELEAHVHKPDGRVLSLSAGDMIVKELRRDVVENAVPPVHFHETILIFPDLAPGDSIAYKFTRYGPEWSWLFNRLDMPVLFSRFAVEKRWQKYAMQVVVNDRHDLNPQKTIVTGAATAYLSPQHVWTATNVPPIKRESYMPPMAELASNIAIWYRMPEADLGRLVRCYRDWITRSGEPGRRAGKLADEITKGMTARADKAQAIHKWVRNHLNIRDPGELSDISPHWHTPQIDLERVLIERSATCEQAASLVWAMLKSQGIDTDVVLTNGSGDSPIDESMHDLAQFTQVFLALDGGVILDTTSRSLPFGAISWKYQGRDAIFARKNGHEKQRLPTSSACENTVKITADASVDADGSAQSEARIVFAGQNAYSIRRKLLGMTAKQQQGWIDSLIGKSFKRLEIQESGIKHLQEPDQPLEISARFRHALKIKEMDRGLLMGLAPFAGLMVVPRFSEEKRENPVVFPYKQSAFLKVRFKLPPGYRLVETPKNVNILLKKESPAIQLKASFNGVQEQLLEMSCDLIIDKSRIPAEDFPHLRDIFNRYNEISDGWIFLEKAIKG